MVTFHKSVGVLAALSSLIIAAPSAVHAQAGAMASVDVEQVVQNSKEFAKNAKDLKALDLKLEGAFTKLTGQPAGPASSALFLSDTEFRELDTLYLKENPTEADKKRITELETKGDQAQGDLNRLQSTAAPTPEEKKRYDDLKGRKAAGENNVAALNQEYKALLNDKDGAQRAQLLKDVRAAIATVAKAKSLAAVFDSTIALYTANDITPDVIAQINK